MSGSMISEDEFELEVQKALADMRAKIMGVPPLSSARQAPPTSALPSQNGYENPYPLHQSQQLHDLAIPTYDDSPRITSSRRASHLSMPEMRPPLPSTMHTSLASDAARLTDIGFGRRRGSKLTDTFDAASPIESYSKQRDPPPDIIDSGRDAKFRKQAAYAAELEQQMREQKVSRQRERPEMPDRLPHSDVTGVADPKAAAPSDKVMLANSDADSIRKAIQSGHTFTRYRFVSEEDQLKAVQKQQQQAEIAAQLEAQVASRRREKEMEQQRWLQMEREEENRVKREQAEMSARASIDERPVASAPTSPPIELPGQDSRRSLTSSQQIPTLDSTDTNNNPALRRKLRQQQMLAEAAGRKKLPVSSGHSESDASKPWNSRETESPKAPPASTQVPMPLKPFTTPPSPLPPAPQSMYDSDDSLAEFTKAHAGYQPTLRRPTSAADSGIKATGRNPDYDAGIAADAGLTPQEIIMMRKMQAAMSLLQTPPATHSMQPMPAMMQPPPMWYPPVPMMPYPSPYWPPPWHDPTSMPYNPMEYRSGPLQHTGRNILQPAYAAWAGDADTRPSPRMGMSHQLKASQTFQDFSGTSASLGGDSSLQWVGRGRPLTGQVARGHNSSALEQSMPGIPEGSLWGSSTFTGKGMQQDATKWDRQRQVPIVEQSLNSSTLFVMLEAEQPQAQHNTDYGQPEVESILIRPSSRQLRGKWNDTVEQSEGVPVNLATSYTVGHGLVKGPERGNLAVAENDQSRDNIVIGEVREHALDVVPDHEPQLENDTPMSNGHIHTATLSTADAPASEVLNTSTRPLTAHKSSPKPSTPETRSDNRTEVYGDVGVVIEAASSAIHDNLRPGAGIDNIVDNPSKSSLLGFKASSTHTSPPIADTLDTNYAGSQHPTSQETANISQAEIEAALRELEAATDERPDKAVDTAGYADEEFEEDEPEVRKDTAHDVYEMPALAQTDESLHSWGLSPDEVALHKRRLLAFYTVHAPPKAHAENVDAAWQLFGPKVWDELERKYKNKTAGFRPSPAHLST